MENVIGRLNLGCGHRFRADWMNVDFVSTGVGVMAHDLRKGIPFESERFDLVYHSHVLEHLPREAAPRFLAECFRVLRRGGVLRVVVPDLEQIARLYLGALDEAAAGDATAALRHQWMQIELCDQMTRAQSGGEWARTFPRFRERLPEFIASRVGVEAHWWENSALPSVGTAPGKRRRNALGRLKRVLARAVDPRRWREQLLRLLLGAEDYSGLTEGRFRQSGEVHRWMYDFLSLQQLLADEGFTAIIRRTHDTGYAPDWHGQGLDADTCGRAAKPDSLYMEAKRP